MTIKNIVFDIGNVLIKWSPYEIINATFPDVDAKSMFAKMRPLWIDLNLGKLTMKDAIKLYSQELDIPEAKITELMETLKSLQTPIPGSVELLKKLKSLGFNLYSITDNIKELLDHHRAHSEFPHYFKDIISSADLGILKPDARIYQHLLDKHNLIPDESVFIDDIAANVEGARAVGMNAFQFTDTEECILELSLLGVNFK